MSHFVVVVTRTDEETLESQLEPFDEQGGKRDYFMEREYYLKKDEKEVQEWLKDKISDAETREKDALKEFEKEFPDISTEELEKEVDKLSKESALSQLNQTFEKVKLGCIARRIIYAKSDQKKLKEIQQLKKLNKKMKAIKKYNGGGLDRKGLYWVYNPEAKWDWWTIGGRRNNWLITNYWEECNCGKVKDLSLDNMRINQKMNRAKWYVKEIEVAKREHRKPSFWNYKKKPTIKQYIEDADCSVAPFAILHDGEWMEKGEMGWWGISDDKYTKDDWAKFFKDFIEKLDPETEITVVDCHI